MAALGLVLGLIGLQFLGNAPVEGSGTVKEERRAVAGFAGVALSGSIQAVLSEGDFQVKLQGDDNLLPLISIEVKDGVLHVKPEKSFISQQGVIVHLSLPKLTSVQLVGSGGVKGQTPFSAENLSLSVAGSGDLTLAGDFKHLTVNTSGSADLNLSGTTEEQTVNLSGSGEYRAQELECAGDTTVNLTGSGNCRVQVGGKLIVKLTGSGNVQYHGEPGSVDSKVSGSGSVTKL